MTTAFEYTVERVREVLQAAGLKVVRHAVDEIPPDACPAVIVRRGSAPRAAEMLMGRSRYQLTVIVHCCVAADAWETEADALHQAVHQALVADQQLAGAGIELTETQPRPGTAGDVTTGALLAAYALTVHAATATLNALS
jgi:hypothetical protein